MTPLEQLRTADSFDGETFVGLDAHAIDLSHKEFEGCTFRNMKLSDSRWMGAVLEDCTLEGCDLSGAVPRGMVTRDVRFNECKLLGVDWTGLGTAPRVAFESCDLRYAIFSKIDLTKTAFIRSNITEASFVEVDLSESDFDGSDLTGTTFTSCVLRKADFTRALGVHLDPAKNRVKDVRVSIESAVLLAASFGMRVGGFQQNDVRPRRRR